MRFITGSQSFHNFKGVLMAYKNYTWGTVCDDSFHEIDAKAACHSLGFNGLTEFQTKYHSGFSKSEVSIAMDDVECTSSSEDFVQCKHNGCPNNACCSHNEDILLTCD